MKVSSLFSKVSGGIGGFMRTFLSSIFEMKGAAIPAHVWAKPKQYGQAVTRILYRPREY